MLIIAICAISVIVGILFMSETSWWERHIINDFHKSGHHTLCFNCNISNNEDCHTERCPIIIELKRDK